MYEKLWLGCRICLLHHPLFKQDEQFRGKGGLCFSWRDLFDISFPRTYPGKWHLHSEEWAASQEKRQVKLLLPFQLPPYFSLTVTAHQVRRIFTKILWLQTIMDCVCTAHLHLLEAYPCAVVSRDLQKGCWWTLCKEIASCEHFSGYMMLVTRRKLFIVSSYKLSEALHSSETPNWHF